MSCSQSSLVEWFSGFLLSICTVSNRAPVVLPSLLFPPHLPCISLVSPTLYPVFSTASQLFFYFSFPSPDSSLLNFSAHPPTPYNLVSSACILVQFSLKSLSSCLLCLFLQHSFLCFCSSPPAEFESTCFTVFATCIAYCITQFFDLTHELNCLLDVVAVSFGSLSNISGFIRKLIF